MHLLKIDIYCMKIINKLSDEPKLIKNKLVISEASYFYTFPL